MSRRIMFGLSSQSVGEEMTQSVIVSIGGDRKQQSPYVYGVGGSCGTLQ